MKTKRLQENKEGQNFKYPERFNGIFQCSLEANANPPFPFTGPKP